jgi:alanine dehydrogenase
VHTYLIKKSDVARVLDMETCIESVENAFRLFGQAKFQMPARTFLTLEEYNGDIRSTPAYIPEYQIAGIMANCDHPDNYKLELPTKIATILLIDPKSGFPIAVVDGTYISNMRTGAAGGIAARYLANKTIDIVGFVGAGKKARALFDALMIVHPEIKKIKVYDIIRKHSDLFAEYCISGHNVEVEIVDETAKAVTGCGIVNTSTSSRKPLFNESIVSAGTHINAIGADSEGRQEMSSSILKKSIMVVDDWNKASDFGEINVPFHMGEITRADIQAELGEIIIGEKNGRMSEEDITVFDSVGLAVQDIITAWNVYKRLLENEEYKSKLQDVSFLD